MNGEQYLGPDDLVGLVVLVVVDSRLLQDVLAVGEREGLCLTVGNPAVNRGAREIKDLDLSALDLCGACDVGLIDLDLGEQLCVVEGELVATVGNIALFLILIGRILNCARLNGHSAVLNGEDDCGINDLVGLAVIGIVIVDAGLGERVSAVGELECVLALAGDPVEAFLGIKVHYLDNSALNFTGANHSDLGKLNSGLLLRIVEYELVAVLRNVTVNAVLRTLAVGGAGNAGDLAVLNGELDTGGDHLVGQGVTGVVNTGLLHDVAAVGEGEGLLLAVGYPFMYLGIVVVCIKDLDLGADDLSGACDIGLLEDDIGVLLGVVEGELVA